MKQVDIYTDGACSGNPGPGGYGAILSYKNNIKELSGNEINTTNNRMEITAVIKALSSLKEKCGVKVYTDSKYTVDCIDKGWVKKWKSNGWIKSDKKEALNTDLLDILLKLCEYHNVEFVWIKGHNGHPQNERCDYLARKEIEKLTKLV